MRPDLINISTNYQQSDYEEMYNIYDILMMNLRKYLKFDIMSIFMKGIKRKGHFKNIDKIMTNYS